MEHIQFVAVMVERRKLLVPDLVWRPVGPMLSRDLDPSSMNKWSINQLFLPLRMKNDGIYSTPMGLKDVRSGKKKCYLCFNAPDITFAFIFHI